MVKPFFVLANGLRLFAVRLPSLSRGMECGDCGITFDILPMFWHGSAFVFFFLFTSFVQHYRVHNDDLEDGYKVTHLKKTNIMNNASIDQSCTKILI